MARRTGARPAQTRSWRMRLRCCTGVHVCACVCLCACACVHGRGAQRVRSSKKWAPLCYRPCARAAAHAPPCPCSQRPDGGVSNGAGPVPDHRGPAPGVTQRQADWLVLGDVACARRGSWFQRLAWAAPLCETDAQSGAAISTSAPFGRAGGACDNVHRGAAPHLCVCAQDVWTTSGCYRASGRRAP